MVVNFPAGSLVSANGQLYQSTTATFALSDPIFLSSYYAVFAKNITYGAEGMVFILLSVLLIIIQLVIANRKGYHEIMSFIMALQIVGLIRSKIYPIDFNVYSVLVGYSYFELSFIPNGFITLFPVNYNEIGVQSVIFSFGSHNLINNIGSIIEIYVGLQILLGIYYIVKNDKPIHLARMKLLQ